jgi:2-methylisocitrate lyase-like PEP mutase family enzyme
VHRIKGPINVIAEPNTPAPAQLDELGVARMTWGSNLATAAYAAAVRIAASALA